MDETIQTTKYSKGINKKEYIMVHHTGSSLKQADIDVVKYLATGKAQVSCHIVVGKDKIRKIADYDKIARHAGKGTLNNIVDTMNYHAIGIEVISDGYIYNDYQRMQVAKIIRELHKEYNIPFENIIRHADYSSSRGKRDIGPHFFGGNWNRWKLAVLKKLQPRYRTKKDITNIVNNIKKLKEKNIQTDLRQRLSKCIDLLSI